MNTLQYFLSTLRPAPPPSPRASTSELPISAALGPSDSRADAAELPIAVQLGELDADEAALRDGAGADAEDAARPRVDATSVPRVGVTPPSRRSSRKGKARDPGESGLGSSLGDAPFAAGEDPLRDGETVKTELERGEGVEGHFVDSGAPPTGYNGTLALRDPEKGVDGPASSALPGGKCNVAAPAWPWMTTFARWWPVRLSAELYMLVRRFLALFGLPYSPRPGYNALLAPAHAALSSEPDSVYSEKGGEDGAGPHSSKRHARLVSLALTLSQRRHSSVSHSPHSRSLSPYPSPAPSTPTSIPRPPLPAPKLTPKTLVLDLDETLIHSTSRANASLAGKRGAPKGLKTRVVEVVLDGRSTVYTVYKRPWVDFFLRKVSSWYTVVIFTASLPEYADPVIDWLDGGDGRGGMVGARLFRADCLARNGSYVKDLSVVDADLSRVCLVDNSPASYAVNQANGIPIEGWINDPHDECLLDLLPMLDSLRFTNDVRRVLGLRGFAKREGGLAIVEGAPVGVGRTRKVRQAV
ncbi:Nem1-Spo7 phosphatase catalytic subunit NEM1 [Rhodotorula paludigena]|uniref:Nem1-Spo7 phosphatase catalytic subunit NEM1 n=1 Tax=Rhodotorula paludigena TaxID=86838 RepID=UPI00317D98C4